MINSCGLHIVQCQLMKLLPDQFSKRTDFRIISTTWLCLFPNLILRSFNIFNKRVFGFVGIKSIVFFFLATVLITAMSNFQFWVGIKLLKMLHISTFFHFFNVLLNKSNCFRTVELHVVQLIVILFHLTTLTDLILYYFNLLHYQIGQKNFFCIYYHHLLDAK